MTVLLISPSSNYASAAVQTCDYCGEENDRFDKTWLKTPGGLTICPACQEESQAEKRNQRVAVPVSNIVRDTHATQLSMSFPTFAEKRQG